MRAITMLTAAVFFALSCGRTAANAPDGFNYYSNSAASATEVPAANGGVGTKENHMSETGIRSVAMTAEAKKTADSLVIDYTVENLTDQNLYLWDQMVGFEGFNQKIDHDGAYVFFEEPDKLNVIRADLPLPTAFDIAKKTIPYVRLLPPRGTLTGQVKLKHPVVEESPYYGPPAADQQKKVNCSEVVLYVGWTPLKSGMKLEEETVGSDKVFSIRGAWPPPYQEVLKERLQVNVEAIIYTGEFERQKPLQ